MVVRDTEQFKASSSNERFSTRVHCFNSSHLLNCKVVARAHCFAEHKNRKRKREKTLWKSAGLIARAEEIAFPLHFSEHQKWRVSGRKRIEMRLILAAARVCSDFVTRFRIKL